LPGLLLDGQVAIDFCILFAILVALRLIPL
jgi:hypothetical protein